MKTLFIFWILFVVLIWFSDAKKKHRLSPKDNGETGNVNEPGGKFLPETEMTPEKPHLSAFALNAPNKRTKRYSYVLPWRKDRFTYSILKYTRDLRKSVQERVLSKAFQIWHEAAPQLRFKFQRNDPKADFKIRFEKGDHGDGQPFDGSGPKIAHVFAPEGGQIHFDDDEWFTDKSRFGTNLLSAAVHEVGHALGLTHSSKKSAVMHKLYKKYRNQDIKLDSDDIAGIKALYRFKPSDRGDPNCKDKDRRTCAVYKKEGYCVPDYEDVMKEFCQFTCGLCKS